jgi:membrane protease YdiL (CAAX protease family)
MPVPLTPRLADHVLLGLSLVLALAHWLWIYPRVARRIQARLPNARVGLYRYIVGLTWAVTACLATVWSRAGRPWSLLGLRWGGGWHIAVGALVAALFVGFVVRQRHMVLSRVELLRRVGQQFAPIAPMIPREPAERRWFQAVALTAGFCEELFYRGFLLWYFSALGGPLVGMLGSSLVFGIDHRYLGRSYVLRTALGGVFFAAVTLAAQSLWPAMLMHAAVDLLNGDLGERALAAVDPPAAHAVAVAG